MVADNVGAPGIDPEMYAASSRRVLGLCRLLLGSPTAAEDAASEVFLRAQRAMTTYDRELPFLGWIMGIARHHCLDLLRRRRTETRLFTAADVEDVACPGPSAAPLGELLAAEERAAVRAAVDALPERYRAVIVLRYYEDLGYDQIGEATGLSRQNVANLIFRAKRELRRRLGGDPQGDRL